MTIKKTLLCPLLIISCLVSGCNSSSSGQKAVSDYSGTWDVRYNFTTDDCGLALEGLLGFVDQHFIVQDGGIISFESQGGLLSSDSARIDSSGALQVEDIQEGDLFGDGSFCSFRVGVSYQDAFDNTATSLFDYTLGCNDGFECSSQAVGQSRRQPV